jgi:thiamine-monophosphate kinase
MSVLNERAIIDIIISNLGLRGNNKRRDDDVSTVSLRNMKRMKSLIIKCDMLVESTDVPPGMYPWQIARKSISACVRNILSLRLRIWQRGFKLLPRNLVSR